MTTPDPLLQVRDLRVNIGERTVLHSVSLDVQPGQLVVLMGANGSGKSTLGMALAGHPHYQVQGGQALLAGQDLLALPAHERARAGLFLSFQSPPDVPGVKNNLFIRTALNAQHEARGQEPLDAFDFLSSAKKAAKDLGLPEAMLGRPVNEGFSGGEKKRHEILQLGLLKPKFAILDETDSGLDVDALRIVSEGVNRAKEANQFGILMVTHYTRILRYIKPDIVHVFADGHFIKTGGPELADELEETGYDAYLPEGSDSESALA